MKTELIMPQMGESIVEATISKWLKRPGDPVKKDEVVVEISTEKVDTEVRSPVDGVLTEALYEPGTVVKVNQKIAIIDSEAKATVRQPAETKENITPVETTQRKPQQPAEKKQNIITPSVETEQAVAPDFEESEKFFSPLVKTVAFKFGVSPAELETIRGTGPDGRITKEDVMAFLEAREGKIEAAKEEKIKPGPTAEPAPARPASPAAKPQAKTKESATPPSAPFEWGTGDTAAIPLDTMRQAIAEHMVRSKHTSPHVYSVQEVDMTAVSKWRKLHKQEFEATEGFSLSFTPFFLEAATKALVKHPHVNSSLQGNNLVLKKDINLGCAVALGDPQKGAGLIVPVIRKAQEKNLVGLARALNDLAARARTKKLVPDEVLGGTFTVTNPGVFGTLIGTPVINQPQAAILCLGAIKKRPVAIDDMIAVREMVYLTLSYDHRIIDGSLSGMFLASIREYLESWDPETTLY